MPTKRLPKSVRRQLEASLESLTPRQAGKLFLLYSQEAAKKKIPALSLYMGNYPPTDELRAALLKQVDPKSPQSVNRYNGFLFLSLLVLYVRSEAEKTIDRLTLSTALTSEQLTSLMRLDQVSDVAREATQTLANAPRPISPDLYQQLLAWAERNGSEWLTEFAEEAADTESRDGVPGDWLEVEYEDRRRLAADRLRFPYMEDEKIRRDWVAERREEAVLKQHFEGDRDRLEHWLLEGGHTNPQAHEAFHEERTAYWTDRLTKAYEAGQLEGFEAVFMSGVSMGVFIQDGRLPAWAALRRVWPKWLAERQYRTYERPFGPFIGPDFIFGDYVASYRPTSAFVVYTVEGEVSDQQLANLVGVFVEECRQRPWGDGLASSFDPVGLGRFLTAKPSPIDYIDAPDLGTVAWRVFLEDIGTDFDEDYMTEDPFEGVALLSRSLEAARDQLGLPADLETGYQKRSIQRMFYPTENPGWEAFDAKNASDKLATIRLDYPSFVYREEDRFSPIFGEFQTPLQIAIALLGRLFGEVATFKLAVDTVSKTFFDGLPLLSADQEGDLAHIEDMLAQGEALLGLFTKDLSKYPWLVDADRLKLVKTDASPEKAMLEHVRDMVSNAWYATGLRKREAVDLGEGDFNIVDWLAEGFDIERPDDRFREDGKGEG